MKEINMRPIRTDPEGLNRVRVQFIWQLGTQSKSPWIRVLSAHGGAGKGFHILPEIGEEVLVGFVGGNGENPYVIGSFYNGKQKSGFATENNDLKVIKTRSGVETKTNDAQGSWKQSTPDGNLLDLQGDGNAVLNITKDLIIKVGGNMRIEVGGEMYTLVKEDNTINAEKNNSFLADNNVLIHANEEIQEKSGDRKEIINNVILRKSQISETFAEEINVISTKENLLLQSAKSVVLNSGEQSNNS